jgi:hypothetical protein
MPQWPTTQADLEHTLIAAELRCGRCSYNLRGLSPLGVCPECGHDIWSSVVRTVDPDASRLPRLSNPKMVAWAILWIMLCATAAALLLAFGAGRDSLKLAPAGVLSTPFETLAFIACAIVVAALPGVLMLAPPRKKEQSNTIWVRLWLLAIGLVMWAASSYWWSIMVYPPRPFAMEMVMRFAMIMSWVIALLGVDGILKAIGQRSRAYRTARGGRQSAKAMIAAAFAVALGTTMQSLARLDVLPARLEGYGSVIVWTSTLMLLIGLAYMLINTLWIFRALRKPSPPLSAILLKVEDRGRAGPNDLNR